MTTAGPGPENDLDNLVDYITIYHKSKAHTEKHVNNLDGVATLNVSIRNVSDLVDSPVKGVEILPLPGKIDNGRVGSGREYPTNYTLIKKSYMQAHRCYSCKCRNPVRKK